MAFDDVKTVIIKPGNKASAKNFDDLGFFLVLRKIKKIW